MTNDEQIAKAALDMAAERAETVVAYQHGPYVEAGHMWSLGNLVKSEIQRIAPADVLKKVGDVAPAVEIEPPRLMAMCGHCRSAGEEYCVQYLTDLRWDGAEWCCEDCFDGSGENGDWDEATQPCPQPAPDAVARLVDRLQAENERLRNALVEIAHTFTERSDGTIKTYSASFYQEVARAALAQKGGE